MIIVASCLLTVFSLSAGRKGSHKSFKGHLNRKIAQVENGAGIESSVISEEVVLNIDSLIQVIETPDSAILKLYESPRALSRPKIFQGYQTLRRRPISVSLEERYKTLPPADSLVAVDATVFLIPDWLKNRMHYERLIDNMEYYYMIHNPESIDYAEWDLPKPPRLPEEDYSFAAFLKKMNLPKIDPSEAKLPEIVYDKKYWLHYFNTALQLSQAYISTNWYQGGSDYLAILYNLNWNVDLNTNFKPNLLFQSQFQYKLGINSNPKGSLHRYNFSQDLLQYNLKMGVKAFKHWFYSFNLLFNTQLFNGYEEESPKISSAFLSPGTLNLGIGMTYNFQNPKKTFKVSASISPLAYNLKTCIKAEVDPAQFNIRPGKKTVSEIGSSGEANFEWSLTSNITWKSRVFLFSDYKYFLAEWENTFNFQLNRFLSTQLYLYPRYDSSSELNGSKWKHWMLREILSFGVSYTFSTKDP